ncbi:MAG: Acyl-CoA dehydrogenase, short-chain specific [Deltaproteobacteria bacterium]|nr:Acyl-CoA dehydrogenase, short-chain specific [Deltaproteobacteria bacterium]
MKRDVYGEDHELYREQFRRFAEKEIAPKIAGWNEAGMPDRETWRRLGEAGFLGATLPEAYGGAGGDFLYDAVVMEELAWLRAHALMFSLHVDICAPYIRDFGTEDHRQRFLAGAIRGEVLLAVAMTEPGTGSDLARVQTRAIRDGDHYVVNGSKTFISHGQIGDLFIVVCKTDPDAKPPHRGISLLLVEAGTPGFVKGRKLDKLGLPGQDTSELFFQDCRVPVTNLLGEEGQGFRMLMTELQQERLCIAIASIASCRRSLADTIDYVKGRSAFGQPIATFQNTQFKLAELATEVEIGQVFVDRLLASHVRGDDVVTEVSMAKWWTTDLQKRLTAECLQLHGGYGFMKEYAIAGDFADAAVQSIYAGTNEIMKRIIAQRIGLG